MASDLQSKLSAVGEFAPERPSWIDESQGPDGDEGVRRYAIALESLAARLAERLAKYEPVCDVCGARAKGFGTIEFRHHCSGSGRARV